jgi:hypothetical protein
VGSPGAEKEQVFRKRNHDGKCHEEQAVVKLPVESI